MNIGDIFVSLRADGAGFKKDVEKAASDGGDAAGKSFTQRFGSQIRTGASAVALGAGALFAAATKGALEMQDAVAKYRAETGASEEDAKAAINAANELSKTHLQTFSQITETLTAVTTQMGLTGDQATKMTDQILTFSTATGQDAVTATKAFDDILDAWNLTAADAQGIMDALVVSHQKYGGTIEENESALQKLAPALTAANMTWQDGVGLLNLFNDAGIAAADAVPAMQRALTKVHSPEELKALLVDISNTDDGFARATKAADLFGSRGGAKLGAALGAAHGDLDQYKVDMQQAEGATTDAASAIENTLPNKIKLGVANALAEVRKFGDGFGPALTGIASLASIGTSFASALKLDDALKGAWTKAAANQTVSSAATAAGGVLGKAFVLGATVGLAALLADAWIKALRDAQTQLENDPGSGGTGQFGPRSMWAGAKVAAQKEAADIGVASLEAFNKAWNDAIAAGNGPDAALAAAKFAAGLNTAFQHDTSFAKSGFSAGGSWADTFIDTVVKQVTAGAGQFISRWDVIVSQGLLEHNTSFKKAAAGATGWFHAVHDAGVGVTESVRAATQATANRMRTFTSEWRGDWINVVHRLDLSSGNIHQTLAGMRRDTNQQLKELEYDLSHPHQKERTLHHLQEQMKRAMRDLKAAQKNGDADLIAEAQRAVDAINAKMDQLSGNMSITATVHTVWKGGEGTGDTNGGGGPGRRASGGPVPEGWSGLVGENGPEWLTEFRGGGGFVRSNSSVRSSLASMFGGAGAHGELHHRITVDPIRVDGNLSPEAAHELGLGVGSGIGGVLVEMRRQRGQPVGAG